MNMPFSTYSLYIKSDQSVLGQKEFDVLDWCIFYKLGVAHDLSVNLRDCIIRDIRLEKEVSNFEL